MSNPAAYYMFEILGLRYNVIDSVSNLTWLWVWVHAGALHVCMLCMRLQAQQQLCRHCMTAVQAQHSPLTASHSRS